MKLSSNLNRSFFILLLILFCGCGEKNNNRNNPAFLEELANREIKKVSDADIMKAAYDEGKEISSTLQNFISERLQENIQKAGIQEALKYCNVEAYAITDSISSLSSAGVKRTSLKTRNKLNDPDSLETMLLDSYLYNVENGVALDDNVQQVDEEYLLYTKPIVLNNPLCLQCHGEVGKDLSLADNETIKSLYPRDEAVNYQPGDFRGMWSIKLSKKELIKSL